MKLSEAGLQFVKKHEGVVLKVYDDGAGYPTAGVGHLLDDEEKKVLKIGDKISMAQAENWLRADVKEAEDCINKLVLMKLTQEAFDSLVSFVFNVGCEAFRKSTLLRYLNKGLWEDASEQFDRWVSANGVKMAGLVKRRADERKLFLSTLTKEVV